MEFPNSKIESPSRSTPEGEAVKTEKKKKFSAPTEELDIKEPIATSEVTETQPNRPTDKPRRSVGSRTGTKIPFREKQKPDQNLKQLNLLVMLIMSY